MSGRRSAGLSSAEGRLLTDGTRERRYGRRSDFLRAVDERKAALAAGRRPRIAPILWREVDRLHLEGQPDTEIGRRLHIGTNQIQRRRKLAAAEGGPRRSPSTALGDPPDPVPYDQLAEEARAALDTYRTFATEFLGLRWVPWHQVLVDELMGAYHSDEDEFLVVNAFPGSGKSSLVTYAFAAWFALRERAHGREPRILLGHRQDWKARQYATRLAGLFTNNVKLLANFGRCRPLRAGPGIPWSTTQLMLEPLDWSKVAEKEPTFSVGSYEGAILSGRYDVILWDDLLARDNQSTPEQREKVRSWWEQEAQTRLDPGGLLVLSNARYGPDDLSRTLLDVKEPDDPDDPDAEASDQPTFRRVIFPAHVESACRTENGKIVHDGPWPDGCLLDPWRLSRTGDPKVAWRKLRRLMRNERLFSLVWQQEDVDPEGFLAERVWFDGGTDRMGNVAPGCFDRERSFGQIPGRYRNARGEMIERPILSVISVDPAASNFWAVIHFLVYQDGTQVVFNGVNRRLTAPQWLDEEPGGGFSGVMQDLWQQAVPLGVAPTHVIIETRSQVARPAVLDPTVVAGPRGDRHWP